MEIISKKILCNLFFFVCIYIYIKLLLEITINLNHLFICVSKFDKTVVLTNIMRMQKSGSQHNSSQRSDKGNNYRMRISSILFALTMTMLVMSVKDETKGSITSSSHQQVPCLFMNDTDTSTEITVQT